MSVCALFVIIYFNLSVGASHITFQDFIDYSVKHIDTKETFLIHNVRMPRMFAGLLIGAALGVSGLLMQAMTLILWHHHKYLVLTQEPHL